MQKKQKTQSSQKNRENNQNSQQQSTDAQNPGPRNQTQQSQIQQSRKFKARKRLSVIEAGNVHIVANKRNEIAVELSGPKDIIEQVKFMEQPHELEIITALKPEESPELSELEIRIKVPSGIEIELRDITGTASVRSRDPFIFITGRESCQITIDSACGLSATLGKKANLDVTHVSGNVAIATKQDADVRIEKGRISTLTVRAEDRSKVEFNGSTDLAELTGLGRSRIHVERAIRRPHRRVNDNSIVEICCVG